MCLYKHKNNTDVALEVLKKFYIREKDAYSLKVSWYRISTARGKILWPLGIVQRIKVERQAWLKDWERWPPQELFNKLAEDD